MISVIASGIILGFAIAILVGPVFFLLLNTSIKKGWIPALYIAFGVALCDIFYVLLISIGFTSIAESFISNNKIVIGEGVLFIVIGLIMIIKKSKIEATEDLVFTNKERVKYFFKGFMLNFLNPSVVIFWFGAVSAATIELGKKQHFFILFFATTIVTVFLFDIIKIYLSRKLAILITEKLLNSINMFSGIIMIFYGLFKVFI